jgi:hypothetical protein
MIISDPDARIVLLGDPQIEGTHRILTQGFYGTYHIFESPKCPGKLAVTINDYYFKHILNNIMWYVQPTHIVVLGNYPKFTRN